MSAFRHSTHVGPLLVAVVTVFVFGVGSTIAAIPNPADGKYYACLARRSGEVRVINYPKVDSCPRGQVLIDWAGTGPAGPTGSQGPQGIPGPEGPAGPQGPTGFASENPGRGTSFPVGVTPGTEFVRTDIRDGMLFRYDGRRWLSDQLFTLDLDIQDARDYTIDFSGTLPTDLDVFVDSVNWQYYISADDATWVGAIGRALFDESSYPSVATKTIAAGTFTAARWYADREPVGTVITTTGGNSGTSTRALTLSAVEQAGTAGVYIMAMVEYRLIAD